MTMTEPPINEYDEQRRQPSTMSLLNELMTNTVDEDYAYVSEHRETQESLPRRRGPRGRNAGLVAATVVFGLLIAVAAVQTDRSRPALEEERAQLVERIKAQSEEVEQVRAQTAEISEDVNRLENEVTELQDRGAALDRRVQRLGITAGSVPVRGPGIQVTVDDGDPSTGEGSEVRPGDLRMTVNGLWESGAEAVSINGERITSRTAIGWANQAITINFDSMRGPYVIRAIGNPNTMEARFFETSAGQTLRTLQSQVGMRFETDTVDDMQIPAQGLGQLRFAEDAPGAAP